MAAISSVLAPVARQPLRCSARSSAPRGRASVLSVVASAQHQKSSFDAATTRRGVLLGGAAAAGLPMVMGNEARAESYTKVIPVDQLSSLQKSAQRGQMMDRAVKVLTAALGPEDAPACMRLVLLDAGTYDINAKTGGMNGSVITSKELTGDDAKALAAAIAKIKDAKKEIDAQSGEQGPISWADMLVLAGKVAIMKEWVDTKIKRAVTPEGGKMIAEGFGAPFEVKIGRVDSSSADSGLAVPGMDASIAEIKAWLNLLGNRTPEAEPGPFTAKPPFWERPGYLVWSAGQLDPAAAEAKLAQDPIFAEFKEKYDKSKRTVTRTDFEVDFVSYYNRLTSFATFDPLAYCYPITFQVKNL